MVTVCDPPSPESEMVLGVQPDACWQRPFLGAIVGPGSAYIDLEILFYWIVSKTN